MSALNHTPAEESLLAMMPAGEARKHFAATGLPGRKDEGWRWTDLRRVLSAPLEASDPTPPKNIPLAPVPMPEAIEVVFSQDTVASPTTLPAGISITQDEPYAIKGRSEMARIAAALSKSPTTLCIEKSCETPIMIRHVATKAGLSATHLQIHIAANVETVIVETYETHEGVSNALVEYFLAENAKLTRVIVQKGNQAAVVISSSLAILMAGAKLDQTTIGFGAKLARMETKVQHVGVGASAILNGISLLKGKSHLDHTSVIDHIMPGCETRELYKAAITGRARGVFQGKFLVKQGAQKTQAQMAHHALLLSQTAEVRAKPELEIYADDVECAHGNTVGALDDDAIFYMRQRGVSEAQARAMLVQAFLSEVIEQIQDEKIRQQFETLVGDWMGAQI
ncbi:MAG: Fe-S cluster assembly protein SufD [Parvularculaceae bacterium]